MHSRNLITVEHSVKYTYTQTSDRYTDKQKIMDKTKVFPEIPLVKELVFISFVELIKEVPKLRIRVPNHIRHVKEEQTHTHTHTITKVITTVKTHTRTFT